jgi:hypothetical protein
MVVAGVLGHVAREPRDPDLRGQLALEAAEEDLALGRLEAVRGGDGALEVIVAEVDEFSPNARVRTSRSPPPTRST